MFELLLTKGIVSDILKMTVLKFFQGARFSKAQKRFGPAKASLICIQKQRGACTRLN